MKLVANPQEHLLIRAARGEKVERTPVWAMRQAGRWDPEFNRVRAGLSFYEFSENPEKAAEASLCPRRFGVDGIILFYDITTLPVAMGLPFQLKPHVGPMPDHPIRSQADLDKLTTQVDPSRYHYLLRLLEIVQRELNGELPILAFAGAPFTVAAYCIGTGKNLDQTRTFAAENPKVWRQLLEKISRATIDFLNEMTRRGAALYQLFDSWAGELTRQEYLDWAYPYHTEILAGAKQTQRILFVKECPYLDLMCQSGADIISLGACHDLAQAKRDYPHLVFQGNVDQQLLKTGPIEKIEAAVEECLRAGQQEKHILNLNHGVDKGTPPSHFEAFIRAAKKPRS